MHITIRRSLFLAGILGTLLTGAFPLALAQTSGGSPEEDGGIVLGWLENIRLLPSNWPMKAKLDSGAKSNAIHAEDIEVFEEDGRRMVRFTVLRDHSDPASRRRMVERPVVGEVAIKVRNSRKREERLVVRLEFCLAGERHNALFTLADRGNFNYPVLLGRDFLRGKVFIDSSESFTHKASCLRR